MAYILEDTILHVKDVSVVYGTKTIIKDVSFDEKDVVRKGHTQGQVIGIVGRSGTGKSTLFRALTGLIKPTTGKIMIPDVDQNPEDGKITAKLVTEGDMGFVDQSYTLFNHKTVYQTCMFALRKSELSVKEKDEKIIQYLSDWKVAIAKDQHPNQLSGGQRQRVAIIEQLLGSGHFIVMDEPFSGLDPVVSEDVKKYFEIINNSHEMNTIIFSTHDLSAAVELADSIYIVGYPTLEESKKASYGTIVKHFDLKQLGLAWQDEYTPAHLQLEKEIQHVMSYS